ncbi:MAG: GNAT family N-acetyltransferase [Actinomycetia bacterium]|nr:GNAT family N-acetyltransferase [Actinomycetes bacterium]MCP4084577.1 GNAT family N-acetyltransferase [Actinomycetes bacterium]
MTDIHRATAEDIPTIHHLELDAGQRFREIGMASVADDPPPSAEHLHSRIETGTIWVAVDGDGYNIVGYAMASVVDGEGHLDQVSVALDRQGQGIGRLLVEHVCAWAESEGFDGVTLTTFGEVAWNGPLYGHLGFEALPAEALGPELAGIRALEVQAGLDAEPRLAMRRPLRP